MNSILFVMLSVTMIMTVTPGMAAEQCTVHWLHPDQPPLVIKKGFGAGMGAVDRTEQFFVDHMKDCSHSFDDANYERIMSMMKQKENVCCVPIYRTPERDKFMEYSVPYAVVIPNALIVVESKKKRFEPFINKDGAVSLEEILKNGFRIGIAKGRVYRGVIDEVLKMHKNSPGIVEHTGSQEMVSSLIKMMVAGRIDGLIGYPFEAQYVAKTMGGKIHVVSIPIAGMDSYGLTVVGCSKTKQGREIIQRLNAIIIRYRATPEFSGFHQYWLDPEALKRHQRYTIKEFRK